MAKETRVRRAFLHSLLMLSDQKYSSIVSRHVKYSCRFPRLRGHAFPVVEIVALRKEGRSNQAGQKLEKIARKLIQSSPNVMLVLKSGIAQTFLAFTSQLQLCGRWFLPCIVDELVYLLKSTRGLLFSGGVVRELFLSVSSMRSPSMLHNEQTSSDRIFIQTAYACFHRKPSVRIL